MCFDKINHLQNLWRTLSPKGSKHQAYPLGLGRYCNGCLSVCFHAIKVIVFSCKFLVVWVIPVKYRKVLISRYSHMVHLLLISLKLLYLLFLLEKLTSFSAVHCYNSQSKISFVFTSLNHHIRLVTRISCTQALERGNSYNS